MGIGLVGKQLSVVEEFIGVRRRRGRERDSKEDNNEGR